MENKAIEIANEIADLIQHVKIPFITDVDAQCFIDDVMTVLSKFDYTEER